MEYVVVTKQTDAGVSAWVPGLPGCWSEGSTETEALENIREALADYLSVSAEIAAREVDAKTHTIRVA